MDGTQNSAFQTVYMCINIYIKKIGSLLPQSITRILMHLDNEPVLSIYEVNYSGYRHF